MQLAPTIATSSPTQSHGATDVVSSSKLFALAATRFTAALGVLGVVGPEAAPNAMLASVAMREAVGGVHALQGVLVPGTPFERRQTAAVAIDQARRALDQLLVYRDRMATLGDGPFLRSEVGTGALLMLDGARTAIRAAINRLS